MDAVETIYGEHGLRAYVCPDPDPTSPEEWDTVGVLSYDVDAVDPDDDHVVWLVERRYDWGFTDGPTWADAVWIATAEGIKRAGLTDPDDIVRAITAEAREWTSWASGDVYYIIIDHEDDREIVESCGGFIGLGYAVEEARRMLEDAERAAEREAVERDYWNGRDVVTRAD